MITLILLLLWPVPSHLTVTVAEGPTTAPVLAPQMRAWEAGQEPVQPEYREWIPADVDWQPLPEWADDARLGPDGHLWLSKGRDRSHPVFDLSDAVEALVRGRSFDVRQLWHGQLQGIDHGGRGWVGLLVIDRHKLHRTSYLVGVGNDGVSHVFDLSKIEERHGQIPPIQTPMQPPPLAVGDSIAFNLKVGVLVFDGSTREFDFIPYPPRDPTYQAGVNFLPVVGSDEILVALSMATGTRTNRAHRLELLAIKGKHVRRASLPGHEGGRRITVTGALALKDGGMLLATSTAAVRLTFDPPGDLSKRLDILIDDLENADPEVRSAAAEKLRNDEVFDVETLAKAIERREKPLTPDVRLQLEALMYLRAGDLPGNRIRIGPFSVSHVDQVKEATNGAIHVSSTDAWQHEPLPEDEAVAPAVGVPQQPPRDPALDVPQDAAPTWPKVIGSATLVLRPDGSYDHGPYDRRAATEAARIEQMRRAVNIPGPLEVDARVLDIKVDPIGRLTLMEEDEAVHVAPVSGYTEVVGRSADGLVLAEPHQNPSLVLFRPLAPPIGRLPSNAATGQATAIGAGGRPWILQNDGTLDRLGDDGEWATFARLPVATHRHTNEGPFYSIAAGESAAVLMMGGGKSWLATADEIFQAKNVHELVEQHRDRIVEAFSGDGRAAFLAGGAWLWADVDGNIWVRQFNARLSVYARPHEGRGQWLNIGLHLWAHERGAVETASYAAPIGDGRAVWVATSQADEARLLFVKPPAARDAGGVPDLGVVSLPGARRSVTSPGAAYDRDGRLWATAKVDLGRSNPERIPYRVSPLPPTFDTGEAGQLPPHTRYLMDRYPIGFGKDGTVYYTTDGDGGTFNLVSIDPDRRVRLYDIPGVGMDRVGELAVIDHSISGDDREMLLVVPYGLMRVHRMASGYLKVVELLAADVGLGSIQSTFPTSKGTYLVLCDIPEMTIRLINLDGNMRENPEQLCVNCQGLGAGVVGAGTRGTFRRHRGGAVATHNPPHRGAAD